MTDSGVVVARRPVVDRDREIIGFELVYHPHVPALDRYPGAEAGVVAVAELLRAHGLGLDDVVGDQVVFCDVDRDVLVGDGPLMLAPRRTVVQVRHFETSEEFLEGSAFRRVEGYRVALDGFSWSESVESLLAAADFVKIHLDQVTREAAAEAVRAVRRVAGDQVRAVAVGCDTEDDVAWAIGAGFHLLQGRAVQAPGIPPGATIAPTALSQVQLGMELLARELELERVERILRADPALVAQVLQMASAGRYRGLRSQVRSLREALVVIGTIRLQRWAAVAILGRHSRAETDDLLTGLVRARMCELLAPGWNVDPSFAFTAGLLSALGLVLGVSTDELLAQLDIDDDLAAAAFSRQGPLGQGIDRIEAYQRRVDLGERPGPDLVDLAPAGAAAFGWAASLVNAVARETTLPASRGRGGTIATWRSRSSSSR